jgi:magnesium-transporting ATPase (P-type)
MINFAKGADTTIKVRLAQFEEAEKILTDKLDGYASNGYRTIMYAMRDLDSLATSLRMSSVNEDLQSSQQTEEESDFAEVEHEYTLLGVSGVEDLL